MNIRKSTDLELQKILALSPKAIFDGTLGEVNPTDEKVEQLVKPLLRNGSHYLIAEENDTIMGWILFGESKDQFTDKLNGFIYELFVIKEFRGNGISKKLINAAVDHLRRDGYTEVRLSAFSGNEAIKLYEKMGFNIRTVTMNLQL